MKLVPAFEEVEFKHEHIAYQCSTEFLDEGACSCSRATYDRVRICRFTWEWVN
jgi:hypothetical protein